MYVYCLGRQLVPVLYFNFPFLHNVFFPLELVVLFVCLSIYLSLIWLQSPCWLPVSSKSPRLSHASGTHQFHCTEWPQQNLLSWCPQNGSALPIAGHHLILGSSFIVMLEMSFPSLLCQSFLYFQSILVYNFALAYPPTTFLKNPWEANILPFRKSPLIIWLNMKFRVGFFFNLRIFIIIIWFSVMWRSQCYSVSNSLYITCVCMCVFPWKLEEAVDYSHWCQGSEIWLCFALLKAYFYSLCQALNGIFSLQTHAL